MRALIVDPATTSSVRLADVPEPTPRPEQALVEVHHVSLNRGDMNDARSGRVAPGAVLGSDLAGVVAEAAADGSGPPAGARVVGLTAAAFAERAAVASASLTVVPEAVDLARAAALPVAGLAALQSLRGARSGPGRRILITGAGGGVGTFAVQLAHLDGAHVLAAVGDPSRAPRLRELGADDVVIGAHAIAELVDEIDGVVDNVGGPHLVAAWRKLAPGGVLQSVGWATTEPAVLPPYATVGPAKSLQSFMIGGDVAADLAVLVDLLARHRIRVDLGWRGPIERFDDAALALHSRAVSGKAVLDLG